MWRQPVPHLYYIYIRLQRASEERETDRKDTEHNLVEENFFGKT